jgi:2,5-diketo-D-gluconate reductase A
MIEADEALAHSVDIGSGVRMPLLGLGTWLAGGRGAYQAVRRALDIGYRHIDTATMNGNEDQIGRAVADSGVPREDIFITTKLQPSDGGRERATIEASLHALSMEYVDLWLIHWPPGGRARPDIWERFLEIQREGLVHAVGVSNYSLAQIDELESVTGQLPSVNQIEWSPALFNEQILLGHRQRGVQLEGYSPLKTTNLRHPKLVSIAQAHGVTPAQVVIRWHIEHCVVVIPKSTNPARIAENAAVFGFALSAAEIVELDHLSVAPRRA